MYQESQNEDLITEKISIDVQKFAGENDISEYFNKEQLYLVFLSKGKLSGNIDNRKYNLHSPLIICLSHRNVIEKLACDRWSEVYIVSFNPIVLNQNLNIEHIYNKTYKQLCEKHYLKQLEPFMEKEVSRKCFSINQQSAQTYLNRILKLEKYLTEKKDSFWYFRARSELVVLLYFIENIMLNYMSKKQKDIIPTEFANIIKYIDEHISETITLKFLYDNFYINANKVEELFNTHYGTTFRQYIRGKRLEIAKDKLRFTSLSNKSIASLIGLSTSQNFCKFFKSMTGTSPDAFRKEQVAATSEDPRLKKTV